MSEQKQMNISAADQSIAPSNNNVSNKEERKEKKPAVKLNIIKSPIFDTPDETFFFSTENLKPIPAASYDGKDVDTFDWLLLKENDES